ncbi:MAG: hypothetical protein WAV23_01870 [Minisyncoccia bacterium]
MNNSGGSIARGKKNASLAKKRKMNSRKLTPKKLKEIRLTGKVGLVYNTRNEKYYSIYD